MMQRQVQFALGLFLVIQMVLGYVGAGLPIIQMPVAQAQGILNGPLNTNASGSQAFNIPKYGGVDQSISDFLCVPNDADLGGALYGCISKLYRFGIAFGAIALVFFLVFAGYMYMTGGETGKQKGKSIFLSAITGMAVILSSYVLLGFINPELTRIKPIQPPVFSGSDLPSCEDVGFGVNCVLPNGQVTSGSGGTGIAGSAAEAKYKDLIQKHADINEIPYCGLSALIDQESSFNRLAYSNPQGVVNESNGPPAYGLSFNVFHAIGLTQVTIYPKASGGWVGDTPARSSKGDFGTAPLTMQMLLDPETNIAAGSTFFGHLYKKYGIKVAYQAYFNGEGDKDKPAPVDLTVKYNKCLLRAK